MRTNNVNYTRFTNVRAVKNHDGLTPAAQRSAQNIGMGLPSFATTNLPANSISKNGDLAFDETLDGVVCYSKTQGRWQLVGNEAAALPSFTGFQLTGHTTDHYLAGIAKQFHLHSAVAFPTAGGNLSVDLDAINIKSNNPNPMNVLFNFGISLKPVNGAENINAAIFVAKNGNPALAVGNAAEVMLSTTDNSYAVSISVIGTLALNEFVSLWLQTNADADIESVTVNATALQLLP